MERGRGGICDKMREFVWIGKAFHVRFGFGIEVD